jgi:hypothetical protein
MIAASDGSPVVQVVGMTAAILWLIASYLYRWRLRLSGIPFDTAPTEGVDPGWGPVFARATFMFPHRKSRGADPLTAMRLIFLAVEIALVLFLLPFSFISPWNSGDAGIAPWVVIGVGLLSLVGIAWVRRRPLDMATESGLAGQFRTLMFMGIGIG